MTDRDQINELITRTDGVLHLEPAFVARTWMKSGRRLGLPPEEYDAGERGEICERWLASTTPAANAVTVEGEGISVVRDGAAGHRLDRIVGVAPELVMGESYAADHDGLGRLAKIFDYGERVPFHIHPPTEEARKIGLNSKDEAYYFLPVGDLGAHPESFFGLHSSLSRQEASDELIGHLKRWSDDRVLSMSKGYTLYEEGGYFVPSGMLHAPGTALTLELQEDSDAMAFLQADCGGVHLSKDLLLGLLDSEAKAQRGEAAILDWIDWDLNLMADFHSAYRTPPAVFNAGAGVEESWIFYGGTKFNGKRLRLDPGASVRSVENGFYSVFVWSGTGTFGGAAFQGGAMGSDEFLVCHDRAVRGVEIVNTGNERVELIKFFGPDINNDVPLVGRNG
ncbi:MAG: hypothetical protein WBB07_24715 [Mycobacterium sp.]